MPFKTYYPNPLKNLLKAAPSMAVATLVATVFVTGLHGTIYHPHDRVERFYFRSNKFERLARRRDEKLRIYFKPAIDWQPNDPQKVSQVKPLFRLIVYVLAYYKIHKERYY